MKCKSRKAQFKMLNWRHFSDLTKLEEWFKRQKTRN